MKILLVDDDLHVIQGINQNMNWNNLGIDTVLSALTADKARELILKESVDIMICDIEMPREFNCCNGSEKITMGSKLSF